MAVEKKSRGVPSVDDGAEAAHRTPLYGLISDLLRKAIVQGSIDKGVVLLEGHVAEIAKSTRTPVRQALQELESEGLVSRFEGRGYVAGPAGTAPRRVALTADMLGIDGGPVRKTFGWESIYDEVERDVVHLSVFNGYRVNELELARHFGVGRMVARDVMLRLERLGLIEKDERLRWVITPLDADRISHLYELRWLLEPVALRAAFGASTPGTLDAMTAELRQAMTAYPNVSPAAMDKLEHDLHVSLLFRCPNTDLLQSLERTRCVLTLSKHVLGATAPMPQNDPFMSEHLGVLAALGENDIGAAETLLRAHLESACAKVTQRVELVRTTYEKPTLDYISER